jgi:hypothetical protein
LSDPRILICPGDRSRKTASDWSSFTDANSSYVMLTAGFHNDETNRAYLRCQVHNNVGYTHGQVKDASGALMKPKR